ncbi:type IV pilus biogenesis protein PilM [Citrobacter koseri]|nr:type IV pilus biogenesis protein PilM [Citrobacter koseri]MBI0676669.1 type IV pilus biogenesis protein PilM [Citrobacter koseri]
MGYGALIVALAMLFMVMTENLTADPSLRTDTRDVAAEAESLARDMLRTASAVNDWRYSRPLSDGSLNLNQLGLSPSPDARIRAVISGGRLWVWTTDREGLRPALARLSSGSALALSVTGGHLLMADGTDMNLPLPSGVTEGNVVYLN